MENTFIRIKHLNAVEETFTLGKGSVYGFGLDSDRITIFMEDDGGKWMKIIPISNILLLDTNLENTNDLDFKTCVCKKII